jgi:hypothetical protein
MNLRLPVQSVPIIFNVVGSNPAHGEVYSIQHYVIKFRKPKVWQHEVDIIIFLDW